MSSLGYPEQRASKNFSKQLSATSENMLRAIAKRLWHNIRARTLLLAGGFQFNEDPERDEITRRPELDREQCPTRLQARQYGWSDGDPTPPQEPVGLCAPEKSRFST